METYAYKPDCLLELAFENLNAQNDYYEFIQKHKDKYGYLKMNKSEEISYFTKGETSSCTWGALTAACRMVNADREKVLATAKAMNRYEKRNQWRISAKLPIGFSLCCDGTGEERTRRFFSIPSREAEYFYSTGRRKGWAEKLPWED